MEFRGRGAHSHWQLDAAHMNRDRQAERDRLRGLAPVSTSGERWLYALQHSGRIGRWRSKIDFGKLSDDEYERDFTPNIVSGRPSYLNQRASLNWNHRQWDLGAEIRQYQPLRGARPLHKQRPRLHLRRRAQAAPFKLDYLLDVEYTDFAAASSATALTGERLFAEAGLIWRGVWGPLRLSPWLGFRRLRQDLDRAFGGKRRDNRGRSVGVDADLQFKRPWGDGLQILRVEMLYLNHDADERDAPAIFDTETLEFTPEQPFRRSVFSGRDRIDDTHQLGLGVETELLDADGRRRFSAGLSQIFNFREHPLFGVADSPLVASLRWRPDEPLVAERRMGARQRRQSPDQRPARRAPPRRRRLGLAGLAPRPRRDLRSGAGRSTPTALQPRAEPALATARRLAPQSGRRRRHRRRIRRSIPRLLLAPGFALPAQFAKRKHAGRQRVAEIASGARLGIIIFASPAPIAPMAKAKIFATAVLSMLFAGPVAAADIDRLIAVVDNGVILQSELSQRLRQIERRHQEAKRKAPPERQLRRLALEQLILETVQLQMAERANILVNDAELLEVIQGMADEAGRSLVAYRKEIEAGEEANWRDFREQLRRQIIMRRLQQSQLRRRIHIGDDDIDDFSQFRRGAAAGETALPPALCAPGKRRRGRKTACPICADASPTAPICSPPSPTPTRPASGAVPTWAGASASDCRRCLKNWRRNCRSAN